MGFPRPRYRRCRLHANHVGNARYEENRSQGAGDGTRTRTGIIPAVFKTAASAVPPRPQSEMDGEVETQKLRYTSRIKAEKLLGTSCSSPVMEQKIESGAAISKLCD